MSGTIEGTPGNDTLTGTAVEDTVFARGGNDSVSGLAGNDVLFGGGGDDSLFGQGDDDDISGGGGANLIDGGAGVDTARYEGSIADFTIAEVAGGIQVGDGANDTLEGIERLAFDDATVLIVDQDGSGAFTTIGAAVAAAASIAGPVTILVAAGTYAENVVINRSDLSLLSIDGDGQTTIDGDLAGSELGTVQLTPGLSNVRIGDIGQGFTINGLNGNGRIEKAAIYLQGAQSDHVIQGNNLVAQGDLGLLSEFGAAITDLLVDGNEFSGQTFVGPQPSGVGSSTQFVEGNNAPRQLVVLGNGGGAGASASSGIVFTNNEVTGTAGGISSDDNVTPQGNFLVTIDASGTLVQGNTFSGFTAGFNGYALRVRRPGTDVIDNTLDFTTGGASRGIVVQNADGQSEFSGNVVTGGGAADVILSMTPGADSLDGAGGNDVLVANAGADTLNGGADDDRLIGGDGPDLINGDGGSDLIEGTSGELAGDSVDGGAGTDTLRLTNTVATSVTLHAGITAIEAVQVATSNAVGGPVFTGTAAIDVDASALDGLESLTGNDGANLLVAGGGGQAITGNAGGDTLVGGAGDDTLDGGAGMDTATYTDTITLADVVASGGGFSVVTDTEGTDTLTNVEIVDGVGPGSIRLVGNGGYATIQEAIDAADAGDTILVAEGTYADPVNVNKSVRLVGSGDGTIITGAITISASGTSATERLSIENLSVTLTGAGNAITLLDGDFITLSGLGISVGNGVGINIAHGGTNNDLVLGGLEIDVTGTNTTNVGLRVSSTATIDGLSLTDSTFTGGYYGIYNDNDAAGTDTITNATFDGLTFDGQTTGVTTPGTLSSSLHSRAIYLEKLENATFSNILVIAPEDPARGLRGINLNLKNGAYENISFDNITFQGFDTAQIDAPLGAYTPLFVVDVKPSATLADLVVNDVEVAKSGSAVGNAAIAIDIFSERADFPIDGLVLTNNTVTGIVSLQTSNYTDISDNDVTGNITLLQVNQPTTGASVAGNTVSGEIIFLDTRETTLPAGADRLVLLGTADVDGTGNVLANTLVGNVGANALSGLGGADTLQGGGGADTLAGGAGDDSLEGGAGEDTATFADAITTADLVLSGAGFTVTTATEGTDTVTGVEIVDGAGPGRILLVGAGGYGSIQAAVDEAENGDTILIAAGTYVEQVVIDGFTGLTLLGRGTVTIVPPATLAEVAVDPVYGSDFITTTLLAIVGSTGVVIDNVNVDGLSRGNDIATDGTRIADYVGIAVYNSEATLTNIEVSGIRDALDGNGDVSGNQRGNAIVVSNTSSQAFTLTDSRIDTFQKTGLFIDTADVTITGNVIQADGPQPVIAQNGIDLRSVTGTVNDNQVLDIGYSGPQTGLFDAAAVLVFDSTGGLAITGNTLNGSSGTDDTAVFLYDSTDVTVTGNTISDFGIAIDDEDEPGFRADFDPTDLNDVQPNALTNVGISLVFDPESDDFATPEPTTLAFTVAGTVGDDDLRGSGGNDTLGGSGGSDILTGRLGNDVYLVGSTDTVVEQADAGTDRVESGVTIAALASNVENLTLLGTGNIDGSGNALDNAITGNAGNNLLNGLGGNDTMLGGLGDDTYVVAQSGDSVSEATGQGTDTVQSSVTFNLINAGAVENLTLTGGAKIDGFGNTLANSIVGNTGANRLRGNGGDDTLVGDLGKDRYTGGTGADVFRFNKIADSGNTVTGADVILDFQKGQEDLIDLSAIDANAATAVNDAFAFIGNAAFSAAGQVRAVQSGGFVNVQINTDGNLNNFEMLIRLDDLITLAASDFLL